MHVDTGAHYRTLTAALLQAGLRPEASDALRVGLRTLQLTTELSGRSALLAIHGSVLADAAIRSPEVNAAVSQFAAIHAVRQRLFDYQRGQPEVAKAHNFAGMIMEGRDIGSVIFPDADFRFFLFADEATRAARRALEGQTDSIAARDKMDTNRTAAPLVCPEGATRIDTGPRTLEEVIDAICDHISKNIS